ncbi:hypothetical protein B1L02_00180 [Pseudoalteromonas piscicida]|nr:hypothetical protein B1L02_00180 [Pseudoalteromonas piscicida]
MSITRRKFCYLVVLNEKFLTQLASDLLLQIEQVLRLIGIIKLLPYSPELNPIEQVWSWLRQHHLANRCFKGYEDIVESCSEAWNDFVSCTKRVVKMCQRDWIEVGKS